MENIKLELTRNVKSDITEVKYTVNDAGEESKRTIEFLEIISTIFQPIFGEAKYFGRELNLIMKEKLNGD